MKAYIADGIFTGENWLPGQALLVADNRIIAVLPADELPADVVVTRYEDAIIAPAFIDVQIYGASEKLFSAYPEPASLGLLSEHNSRGGTLLCLPTLATNSMDVFRQAIDAVRAYWDAGGTGVYGLHLEGPWINALRKGAHIEELITVPGLAGVRDLLTYGRDVIRMITLAPEVCPPEVISYILSENIVISAGHSNATYDQAIAAYATGITATTHLYNAMSPLQHRAPGLVGAAMDHGSVMASIIPDGVHVDFAALRIAARVMRERLFVITDAVTDTEIGPYQHVRAGNRFESDGILSGSALQMNVAVRNLVAQAGLSMEEALRMCSLYPARLLGISDRAGMLKAGYEAAAVVLDKEFNVRAMIRPV